MEIIKKCKKYFTVIVWVIVLSCFIGGCSDSTNTRKHRFLLKGNEALEEQNYQLANQYLQEALKLDSCFSDALNNLGTGLFRQKSYAEALEYYNRSIACNPQFTDARLNRSNTFYALNRLPDALRDAEEILLLRPDTLPALFLEGLIYTKMRQFDKAQLSFLKMLKLDSLNSETYVNLGTLAYYQKRYSEANRYLAKGMLLNPQEANAFNALSLVKAAEGNLTDGLIYINQAIVLKPGDAFYRNNRGYIYLLKREWALALEDINYSIATDPTNAWAYRNKGIYYLNNDDVISAVRLLQQALNLDPFVEKGYYFLAEAYFKSGDLRKACEALKESIRRTESEESEIKTYCK